MWLPQRRWPTITALGCRAVASFGFAVAVVASQAAACLPKPTVPLPTTVHRAHEERQSDCLIVFLPGRGDSMDAFADHGFVRDLRSAGLEADVVAVGAHVGYYAAETIDKRLDADVVSPAIARGYRRVFVVGISMGGLGALIYAARYPGKLHGILLIAPFLGSKSLTREIAGAGGLATWQPRKESDPYEQVWLWLKRHLAADVSAKVAPELYLAFGVRDRFARSHRLVADVLPTEAVLTIEGDHRWAWWRPLWARFLRRHGATICAG